VRAERIGDYEKKERQKAVAMKLAKVRDSFATSFDTMDMKMLGYEQSNEQESPPKALNYRENIQLHDLIMLTDIYSVP